MARWLLVYLIMSTYLVAVVVGLFDYTEGVTPDEMMVSFLTRGLVMVLGYTYPAYECFKIVEKKKTRDQATAILVSVLIGKTNQGKVALDVAIRTLDLYKKLLLL